MVLHSTIPWTWKTKVLAKVKVTRLLPRKNLKCLVTLIFYSFPLLHTTEKQNGDYLYEPC